MIVKRNGAYTIMVDGVLYGNHVYCIIQSVSDLPIGYIGLSLGP